MASNLIECWGKPIEQTRTFQCDYRTDIANLPNQNTTTGDFPNGVPTGSSAYVIEDISIWVLNGAGVWKEFA